MKKKILALCLVVVLAITAVTGATLAYFTETEQQTNEFAVGNVQIDLYETVAQHDGANNVIIPEKTLGEDTNEIVGIKYENIQPGHKMTKIAYVENTGKNDAYVALVIKQEGYLNFNKNVDDRYENKTATNNGKTPAERKALGLPEDEIAAMEKITGNIFPNWNLQYNKNLITEGAKLRYIINKLPVPSNAEGVQVLGVGYAQENTDGSGVPQYHYNGEYFTNIVGQKTQIDGEPDFFTISDKGAHDRVWIVYLKLAPNAVFDMDLTTVCPTYFDNDSTTAFAGMVLDVKAFAIQTTGFATTEEGQKAAFAEALKPGFAF